MFIVKNNTKDINSLWTKCKIFSVKIGRVFCCYRETVDLLKLHDRKINVKFLVFLWL